MPKSTTASLRQIFWDRSWSIVWKSLVNTLTFIGAYGAIWRPLYGLLAFMHRNGRARLSFMNYGFVAVTDSDQIWSKDTEHLLIDQQPINDRTHIALYERTLSLHPDYPKLVGYDLLEVGCGHGGGVQWIHMAHAEMRSVKEIVIPGIDLSIVDSLDGRVRKGNAQNMPFADSSVDIVLNVESSHCYDNQRLFLSECFRVLRPGGYLLWSDFRPQGIYLKAFRSDPIRIGFELSGTVCEWNAQVLKSLDTQHGYIMAKFDSNWYMYPFLLLWRIYWGCPGYGMYRCLQSREFIYAAAAFGKPINKL